MKQFTSPIYIKDSIAQKLESISTEKMSFSEKNIQDLCFNHASILPIEEIEPIFNGQISLCKELAMPSGYCDIATINDEGLITLIECKLWKNPEARRKAIGQILDYAKDLAGWSFEKFESQCLAARKGSEKSLVDIIKEYSPEVDESIFIDKVIKNLKNGRFLLLIVGDGIRENMEEIVDFMNNYGRLSFTLSLVEIPIFKIPGKDEIIITPRVLVKTLELKRSVEEQVVSKDYSYKNTKAISASESEFFDRLKANIGDEFTQKVKDFIYELNSQHHIFTALGRGKKLSLNIKTNDEFNLASIQENGEVWFYGIVDKAQKLGNRQIGEQYLQGLAHLLNADFDKNYKEWLWCVKKKGEFLNIKEYIIKKDGWKKIIEDLLNKISEIQQ